MANYPSIKKVKVNKKKKKTVKPSVKKTTY